MQDTDPPPLTDPPASIELLARALIHSRGRVLLCRNRKHGYSYLPGGHVEPGEAAADAAARELQEEAGVAIRPGALGLVAESRFVQKGRPRHEVTLVFHVEHDLDPDRDVPSLESYIDFWWADLACVQDVDLRPNSAKAWLMSLDHPSPGEDTRWTSE